MKNQRILNYSLALTAVAGGWGIVLLGALAQPIATQLGVGLGFGVPIVFVSALVGGVAYAIKRDIQMALKIWVMATIVVLVVLTAGYIYATG